MTKKYKPLGNRVLVERSQAKTTKGGVILPESAQEKPKQGRVVEVGPGKYNADGNIDPMTLQIGDEVLFSSYAGTEVKDDSSESSLMIISEDDILGVVTSK